MSAFRVTHDVLSADAVLAWVRSREQGGIVLFFGTVRDHSGGLAVTKLEYEAYVSMAEKELARIAAGITSEFPGVRLAAHHRVGPLEIGDDAVVCAASAPHRAVAFDACRALIDRIKVSAPIWKREHGPDGPYWVGWEHSLALPR
jgi:molybdopterin synthase catalytic subunit